MSLDAGEDGRHSTQPRHGSRHRAHERGPLRWRHGGGAGEARISFRDGHHDLKREVRYVVVIRVVVGAELCGCREKHDEHGNERSPKERRHRPPVLSAISFHAMPPCGESRGELQRKWLTLESKPPHVNGNLRSSCPSHRG